MENGFSYKKINAAFAWYDRDNSRPYLNSIYIPGCIRASPCVFYRQVCNIDLPTSTLRNDKIRLKCSYGLSSFYLIEWNMEHIQLIDRHNIQDQISYLYSDTYLSLLF